jgi:hypothetical protein
MFYQIISNKMKEGLAEGSQLEEAAEAWTAYHCACHDSYFN